MGKQFKVNGTEKQKEIENVIVDFNNCWTQLNVDVINITKIFFLKVLNYIFIT